MLWGGTWVFSALEVPGYLVLWGYPGMYYTEDTRVYIKLYTMGVLGFMYPSMAYTTRFGTGVPKSIPYRVYLTWY